MSERHLEFEGVINFRDMGGYRTSSGRTLRWGRLLRSGSLHYMTEADGAHLRALDVRSVLDLRRPDEIGYQGTGSHLDASVVYYALPVVPHKGSDQLNERYGKGISGARYRGYMEFAGPDHDNYFVRAIELLATPSTYPTVFHCTAGKDRTGVIGAFVLDILGVDMETIEADYELSNLAREGLIAQTARDSERRKATGDVPPEGLPTRPDDDWLPVPLGTIGDFMTLIRDEFGSARGYFEAQGVEPATFDRLAELLLE